MLKVRSRVLNVVIFPICKNVYNCLLKVCQIESTAITKSDSQIALLGSHCETESHYFTSR